MWTVTTCAIAALVQEEGPPRRQLLEVDSVDQENFTTYVDVPHAFWFWNNKENDLKLPEKMQRGHYDEFDYAYAITCHKSQGSQWDKVAPRLAGSGVRSATSVIALERARAISK
jgi:hypothetical protein